MSMLEECNYIKGTVDPGTVNDDTLTATYLQYIS